MQHRVRRIYLDELGGQLSSIGIGIVQLVVESKEKLATRPDN